MAFAAPAHTRCGVTLCIPSGTGLTLSMFSSFRVGGDRCSKSFFQVLRLHLGILGHDLLHIVREIGELLHLPDLDHFVVRGRAALRPFDRFLFRLHLDHPVAAQYLFHAREGTGVTFDLPPENDTRAPIEGGGRPSSPSNTPDFCRASLYFLIAATALASGICPAVAASYPFGIISIMNRTVITPLLSAWEPRKRSWSSKRSSPRGAPGSGSRPVPALSGTGRPRRRAS